MERDKQSVLHAHEYALASLIAIDEIVQQLREWYKYDTRGKIPRVEVISTISKIINSEVKISKLYEIGDKNEGKI